jgi:hypothetical protein
MSHSVCLTFGSCPTCYRGNVAEVLTTGHMPVAAGLARGVLHHVEGMGFPMPCWPAAQRPGRPGGHHRSGREGGHHGGGVRPQLPPLRPTAAHQSGLSLREVPEIGGHRGLSALERHLDGHGYLCRFLEPLRYILLI